MGVPYYGRFPEEKNAFFRALPELPFLSLLPNRATCTIFSDNTLQDLKVSLGVKFGIYHMVYYISTT